MKENLPRKAKGDSLSARHVNMLNEAANKFNGMRPPVYSGGKNIGGVWYQNQAHPYEQFALEISNLQTHEDDAEDNGLYFARTLYYHFENVKWQVDDHDWILDCRATKLSDSVSLDTAFGMSFEVGDRLVAYWDEQRASFVPIARLTPREYLAVITESGGIAADSSGEVTLKLNATTSYSPLITKTAYFTHMSAGTATENNDCIIRWIDDQRKWVIVELEC